jgi:hypothetical protein
VSIKLHIGGERSAVRYGLNVAAVSSLKMQLIVESFNYLDRHTKNPPADAGGYAIKHIGQDAGNHPYSY